jgi:hypothetical protein
MRTLIILAVAAAAAAVSGAANAVTCYTLLDKSDNLLFQDSLPPVDMSDQGAALREGLRRRNEYLLVSEVDSCPAIAAAAGTTGYRPATVDEIVGGMRAYATYSNVNTGVSGSAGPAGGGRAAPAAASASRGSSTAARRGY